MSIIDKKTKLQKGGSGNHWEITSTNPRIAGIQTEMISRRAEEAWKNRQNAKAEKRKRLREIKNYFNKSIKHDKKYLESVENAYSRATPTNLAVISRARGQSILNYTNAEYRNYREKMQPIEKRLNMNLAFQPRLKKPTLIVEPHSNAPRAPRAP